MTQDQPHTVTLGSLPYRGEARRDLDTRVHADPKHIDEFVDALVHPVEQDTVRD
jgi:hypothetical protein